MSGDKLCVRCKQSVATERGQAVPYGGAPLCANCAAVLAQDAAVELAERDRRCPTCDTWLDRNGNCPQCVGYGAPDRESEP